MVKYDENSIQDVFRPAFEACGVKINYWLTLTDTQHLPNHIFDDFVFIAHLMYQNKEGWWFKRVENHPCSTCAPGRFFSGVDKYMDRLKTNPRLGKRFYKQCTQRKIPQSTLQDFTDYYLKNDISKCDFHSLRHLKKQLKKEFRPTIYNQIMYRIKQHKF